MTQQTQAVAQRTQTAVALRNLVEQPQYKSRFNELLKERAPQFVASLVQLVNGSEQLQRCEPNSVIASAVTAAALDLPIEKNLGFAWIVPYGGQAQFQMGYRGYVQLAIRTGLYKFINVTEVYEGELDVHNRMTSEIVLRPENKKTDKIIGYAAYFKLVSGYEHAEYWDVETVKAHAQRFSQSFRKDGDTPWKSDFDMMAMKTVLKSLISHWGPMSVEMRRAVTHDMSVQATVESDPTFPDTAPEVKQPDFGGKPQAQIPETTAPPAPPTPPTPKKSSATKAAKTTQPAAAPAVQTPPKPEPAAPTPAASEPEQPEPMFTNPPEPEPLQEAPVTGHPPTPPPQQPVVGQQSNELHALYQTLAQHGITEGQVMQFCYKNKLAKPEQKKLAELATAKLVNLNKNIANPESPVHKQIKETAIDV